MCAESTSAKGGTYWSKEHFFLSCAQKLIKRIKSWPRKEEEEVLQGDPNEEIPPAFFNNDADDDDDDGLVDVRAPKKAKGKEKEVQNEPLVQQGNHPEDVIVPEVAPNQNAPQAQPRDHMIRDKSENDEEENAQSSDEEEDDDGDEGAILPGIQAQPGVNFAQNAQAAGGIPVPINPAINWISSQEIELPEGCNEQIHEGSLLTVLESFLLILQLFLRFHFSKAAMDAICQIISIHCPDGSRCPKSEAEIQSFFWGMESGDIIAHDFCSACLRLYKDGDKACPVCPDHPLRYAGGAAEQIDEKPVSYFLEFPIEKELYRRYAGG